METESPKGLPDGWKHVTLGQLCSAGHASVQVGITAKPTDDSDDGVPYVMPENICNERIVHDSISRTSVAVADEWDRFRLKPGDILCSRRGELNRRAIVGRSEEGWFCGSGCLRLRFHSTLIDPLYAYYYLSHPRVASWIDQHAIGASMPHINKAILLSMPIVLPPLPEQRRIAEILNTLNEKAVLNEAMNANLLEMARVIFQTVVGDWTPQDGDETRQIPAGWRVTQLEECCVRIANGRTPSRFQPDYWNGNIPWLTSTEVRRSIITSTETSISRQGLMASSMKLWPQGTTVVALVGSTAGRTALLAIESSANQACCGVVSRRELQLYVFLHMQTFSEILTRFAKGSAQQNLNQQTIAKFPILIPDESAIAAFDLRVRPLFDRIINNLRESATLREMRSSLMPILFSGSAPQKSDSQTVMQSD